MRLLSQSRKTAHNASDLVHGRCTCLALCRGRKRSRPPGRSKTSTPIDDCRHQIAKKETRFPWSLYRFRACIDVVPRSFLLFALIDGFPSAAQSSKPQESQTEKIKRALSGRPFEHDQRCHSCADRFSGNDEDKRLHLHARRSHRNWHAGDDGGKMLTKHGKSIC
jgi:hypothetical protein